MSKKLAPAWPVVKGPLFEALGSLQFAIDCEKRCGDPNGLVAGWEEQATAFCELALAVQSGEVEDARAAMKKMDAHSREKVLAMVRDWTRE